MTMDDSRTFVIGTLAGLIAAIIWGLWPVLTRFGVTTSFSAQEIVAVRFIFAGVVLLPYYIHAKVYTRIGIFKSLIIASGAGALYVYVSSLGLKFVPAGHLGVVETGTMLVLSAIGGYIFLGEKKSNTQALGYLAVLAGMLIVNWQSLQLASEQMFLGDMLLVVGGVLWAIYTVLSKKWRLNSWDAVSAVSVWSLITWVPLIYLFGDMSFAAKDLAAWFYQGIGQGIITAVFGLWFYTLAVEKLGAARGSLFGALVPVFAVIGGFVFLAESPTMLETIGVSLTTVGISISLMR